MKETSASDTLQPTPNAKPSTPHTSPIEDYGIISNCHTAAIVSNCGSIAWLCLPRFDLRSLFALL